MRRPRLVLIDLDGTLIDSVPDICVAANAMLADLQSEPVSESRVREFIGNGIDRMVHRCLTRNLDGEANPRQFARARELFLQHYADHNGRHSSLYPGVAPGIERLRNDRIELACITNKAGRFSEQLLRHFNIFECFSLLVAGDTTEFKKPHPRPLLHAAEALEVAPDDTLMVGDSIHDVKAARAAGIPVAAVSYGYNHGLDIRDAHPDAVIDSLDRLEALWVRQA